jgi:hypothetical protein
MTRPKEPDDWVPPKEFGFMAGTLVHTKTGLVPIERIKAGDLVLSRHDSAQGDQDYKRVIRTMRSEKELPMDVMRYYSDAGVELAYVTFNQPFYLVPSAKWIRAQNASHPAELGSFDGTPLEAWECMAMWNSEVEGVSNAFGHQTDLGIEIDFRSGQPVITSEEVNPGLSDALTCRIVHSLEVEDFHSYYIGELGLWARDGQAHIDYSTF